jgi:hypothetical protein
MTAAATIADVGIQIGLTRGRRVIVAFCGRLDARGHAADATGAGSCIVGRIRTDSSTSAAVLDALREVRLTAVANVVIAVAIVRTAANRALAPAASAGTVDATADIATLSTVRSKRQKWRFAAIIGNSVTIPVVRLAGGNGTFTTGAGRRTVSQRTNATASAAIAGIRGQRGFAAIDRIGIAVVKSTQTFGNTLARHARRSAMIIGTADLAGAAMVRVIRKICFATIVSVTVAVSPARATSHDTTATHARGGSIDGTAFISAASAIEHVALGVGFATVRDNIVAVEVSRRATRRGTDTISAHER